jgi:hypothetical protein
MGKHRVVPSAGDNGPDIGITPRVSTTVTRPNNTATYTAGDVVGNSTAAAITFSAVVGTPGASTVQAHGMVIDAVAICSVAQTTKPNLKLYLFDGTSVITTAADGDAWAPSDADMKWCIGWAEFGSWEIGSGNIVARDKLFAPFSCKAGAAYLLGVAVERGAYVPAGADVFTYRLGISR